MFQELDKSGIKEYKDWIKSHPQNNLWQSLEYKQYLESLGKIIRIYVTKEHDRIVASAMVMIDKTSFGLSTWDISRGPLWKEGREDAAEKLIEYVVGEAKKEKCLTLYFSPIEKISNFKFQISNSPRHIHCEATRIIDLTDTEAEIFSQMKPKGRYNIRVAEKHEVTVRQSADIDAYFELAKQTGKRDKFIVHRKEKYKAFLDSLPGAFMLLAYASKMENLHPSISKPEASLSVETLEKSEISNFSPIAGILGVFYDNQAIYYYGASNHAYRACMAPYLLQWETIKYAKANGYTRYDLLGIAPPNFEHNHPWKGISSFKEKFGGEVITYLPEQEIVLKPIVKKLLEWKRKFL